MCSEDLVFCAREGHEVHIWLGKKNTEKYPGGMPIPDYVSILECVSEKDILNMSRVMPNRKNCKQSVQKTAFGSFLTKTSKTHSIFNSFGPKLSALTFVFSHTLTEKPKFLSLA